MVIVLSYLGEFVELLYSVPTHCAGFWDHTYK